MTRLALLGIRAYRLILSPYSPGVCRYAPTCSHYSEEAFNKHGFLRGGWLTVKRLGRCHPLGGRGHDPVP